MNNMTKFKLILFLVNFKILIFEVKYDCDMNLQKINFFNERSKCCCEITFDIKVVVRIELKK